MLRAELLNEAQRFTDDEETVERITHLLSGAFAGEFAQEVYRGYLDDARNTDHRPARTPTTRRPRDRNPNQKCAPRSRWPRTRRLFILFVV